MDNYVKLRIKTTKLTNKTFAFSILPNLEYIKINGGVSAFNYCDLRLYYKERLIKDDSYIPLELLDKVKAAKAFLQLTYT